MSCSRRLKLHQQASGRPGPPERCRISSCLQLDLLLTSRETDLALTSVGEASFLTPVCGLSRGVVERNTRSAIELVYAVVYPCVGLAGE